jgi:hypothetical protein
MRGVSPLLHPRLARVFCRCFPGRRLESTASSSSGDLRVPFAIVGQRVGLRVLFIPVLAIFGLHVGFIDVMSRAAAAFPARGSIASFTRVLPPSVLTFSSRVPAELCGGSTDCSESGPWARVWMVSALFAKPEHRTCYPPTCLRVARERFRAYVAICHRCAKGARPLCALFTAAGGFPSVDPCGAAADMHHLSGTRNEIRTRFVGTISRYSRSISDRDVQRTPVRRTSQFLHSQSLYRHPYWSIDTGAQGFTGSSPVGAV